MRSQGGFTCTIHERPIAEPAEPNTGAPTGEPPKTLGEHRSQAQADAVEIVKARETIWILESALRKAKDDLNRLHQRQNATIAAMENSYWEE